MIVADAMEQQSHPGVRRWCQHPPVAPLRNSREMSSHNTRTPSRSNSLHSRPGGEGVGRQAGWMAGRLAGRRLPGRQAGWQAGWLVGRPAGREEEEVEPEVARWPALQPARGNVLRNRLGMPGSKLQPGAAAQGAGKTNHLSAPYCPAPASTHPHLSVSAGCAVAAAPSSIENSYWNPLQPPPSTVTRSATGPPDCRRFREFSEGSAGSRFTREGAGCNTNAGWHLACSALPIGCCASGRWAALQTFVAHSIGPHCRHVRGD